MKERTTKSLNICNEIAFPAAESASQTYGFIGKRGTGKTYAAKKLVEELHAVGAQVVILDPIGNWWSLRMDADGKRPGVNVPVFGGDHGDIDLLPDAGKLVAQVIVRERTSAILDVSDWYGAEQRRFVTAFLVELLHETKRARNPLHVVFEEAQEFAPQRPQKGEEQMLGAMEKLCKKGRNWGVGTSLITQQPQAVNKTVLNQVEVLVVGQLQAKHEREAIRQWTFAKGTEDRTADLPNLQRGTMILWSPQWLQFFGTVRILPIHTLDASATPLLGDKTEKVRELSALDLTRLNEAMHSVVERAEREDPIKLRAKVTRLEAEIKKLQAAQPEPTIRTIEIKVPAFDDADRRMIDDACERIPKIGVATSEIQEHLRAISAFVIDIRKKSKDVAQPAAPRKTTATSERTKEARPIPIKRPEPTASGSLTGPERRLLTILAQHPNGRNKTQLALLAGYARNGGSFSNYLSSLRTRDLLSGRSSEIMTITAAGIEALGSFNPLPTGRELIEHWKNTLPGPEANILSELCEQWPRSMTREEIAAACTSSRGTPYEPAGGSFGNYLSKLNTLGLIIKTGNKIKASDDLFDE